MSFSFLFLATACRMRVRACDTASRLCVRTVLCGRAFPSVPPLPSTGSAAGCHALFASFIGNATGAILTAVGLESLGLGPQRVPTLGNTIYQAISASALLRNMWWWWAIPTALLALMFIGLLLINLGFDEIANPRLRRSST